MQITTSDGFNDHDPDDSLSLTLIPPATGLVAEPPSARLDPSDPLETLDSTGGVPAVAALFAAVSSCANLHPDPASPSSSAFDDAEEEEEAPTYDYEIIDSHGTSGSLPPPLPGSGGWITSENMDDFFDENGEWRGVTGLGPRVGNVRGRDEEAEDGEDGRDGVEGDETKWRRIE
jgi:nucleotide-sensitive chloride channel 1A